jgi:hypothetical protein
MLEVPYGFRFGRWLVLDSEPLRKNGLDLWLCRCDCGEERFVRPSRLRAGGSQSCGCLRREIHKNNPGGSRPRPPGPKTWIWRGKERSW